MHIENFLDYYTALTAPHYAVLLTGKWGIGKTFFITKYMEKIFPKQEDESEKDEPKRAIPVEIGNIIPHLSNRKVSMENIFFRNK